MSTPFWTTEGPPLEFTCVRLVQQADEVWLFGRLANARQDALALAIVEVLVTLYDDAGAVIGVGRGFSQATELRPGERSAAEVRIERLGNRKVPIAAWDYRIDYSLTEGAQQAKKRVLTSSSRVIRTAGAPEILRASRRADVAASRATFSCGPMTPAAPRSAKAPRRHPRRAGRRRPGPGRAPSAPCSCAASAPSG